MEIVKSFDNEVANYFAYTLLVHFIMNMLYYYFSQHWASTASLIIL